MKLSEFPVDFANPRYIVFYLYREPDSLVRPQKVSEVLGMSESSVISKIANFLYLDTDGKKGLANYSKQSEEVYHKFKGQDLAEQKKKALALFRSVKEEGIKNEVY